MNPSPKGHKPYNAVAFGAGTADFMARLLRWLFQRQLKGMRG